MSPTSRVVVVGAGTTGLAAACALADRGITVDLLSLAPPRRAVVASAGDAIAACTSDDEAAIAAHALDATPPDASPVEAATIRHLARGAPALVDQLAASGVPFVRDAAGSVVRRRGSGHREPRVVTAGPETRRTIVEALDARLDAIAQRPGARVRRHDGCEVVAVVCGADGACAGVVAQDLQSMELQAFPAHAVLLASGGFAAAWGLSSASPAAWGAATSAAFRAGAALVDLDRVVWWPLAAAGHGKRLAIADAIRVAGARVWAPLDAGDVRRPRDIPSKARRDLLGELDREDLAAPSVLARALLRHASGADVYVDVTHLGGAFLPEARAEIDRLARVAGVDLATMPERVAPSVHTTAGGLAVRFVLDGSGEVEPHAADNHATSIEGLYAAGAAAAAYRLDEAPAGHRLLASLAGAALAAQAIAARLEASAGRAIDDAALEAAQGAARASYDALVARQGGDRGATLRPRLARELDALVDVHDPASPAAARLDAIAQRLEALREDAARAVADDPAPFANRGAPALRRLEGAALLGVAAAACARARRADPDVTSRVYARACDGRVEITAAPPGFDAGVPTRRETPIEPTSGPVSTEVAS